MRKSLVVWVAAGCSALSLFASCGGPNLQCGQGTEPAGNQCVTSRLSADPLIGEWTRPNSNSVCTFFGNGQWSNGCFLTSGSGALWERISENRYYIGATYYACDTETAFSADKGSVTLSMTCDTTATQVVPLVRFK
jgi:hypothetical protein